ncbi:peptidase [Thraustotheca clavata]|uniref:Peptidase n=1 Tax=Thraustotheca clavata TaxID=74557 RepID=A0A1V9ZN35_9STRA|nr:peptidase [Thraustotheca clavata]
MRIFFGFLGIFVEFVASRYMENDRCTAILVGAKASVTGAPMTTHSNDCGNCDIRLIKVPQMKHSPGELRNITLIKQEYPRYVGSARGPSYTQSSLDRGYFNWTNSPTIGAIPQVNETFAYFEGVYGIMNEHQLSMGESTCGAKIWTKPISQGGHALFDITELGRIALERTKTAREAILLMGSLAETYGYYGASWDDDDAKEEAGEALTITDTKEAWMFHILPDDTGKSAVWVAQRVPDNHITAIANQFVIHHVDLDDTDNFLGSKNMFEIAKRNGFWDGTTVFDFTVAFALEHHDPEQYGYTRRVWRVFQLANPNITLSPFTDDYSTKYPFSIESGLLKPEDLMRIQRDHYEGTLFDLTQGPSAGPYGDPDRFRVGNNAAGGQFERSIGIYRATYTFVTVPHPTNNRQAFFWFGPYAPHATAYVPVYTQISDVPKGLSHGTLRKFDPSYNFWAGAVVGNYAGRFYKFTHPFVVKAQTAVESLAIAAQTNVQQEAEALYASKGYDAMINYLTNTTTYWSNTARDALQTLFTTLVTQCHDGYIMSDFENEEMTVKVMGYPKWWLESVGYYYASSADSTIKDDFQLSGSLIFFFIVVILISSALGFIIGRRSTPQRGYAHLQ